MMSTPRKRPEVEQDDKADGYTGLGKKLRDARLAKKLKLQDVSAKLHIRMRYLEALEEGDFEALPAGTFVHGYLQRYAAHLSLDTSEILSQYEQAGQIPGRRLFHVPHSMRRSSQPVPSLVVASLIAALLMATAWGQVYPRMVAVPDNVEGQP